ncbi:hypothetical protein [Sulfitobacter donghicola]|uniref:Uncharacterized protein n=2 Tax=Sulfitobacter TaxID=60136 RepID=A0A073IBW7_9RHOB|nr:hypothetical protein [Sulfitobacter donghicola]KEJ87823.1 hypothetical protein DSW25_04910 [Sulfitobacter donghicola DSW-25 = KCTC 12864 = JCM 14565]
MRTLYLSALILIAHATGALACYEFEAETPVCISHFEEVRQQCEVNKTEMGLQGNYCEENYSNSVTWCEQTCPQILADKKARKKVAESIQFQCNDPFGVLLQTRGPGWLEKNSFATKVLTADTRNVLIEYPISRALIDNTRTIQKITLSASMAKQLKNAISLSNQLHEVPGYVGKFPTIAGYLFQTGTVSNLIIGELFGLMIKAQNDLAASGKTLLLLMAEGGNLYNIETLNNNGNGLILHTESVVYAVDVGKERRKLILASCTYGAY